jgi:lipopolysaccharide biosynthesis protein
MNRLTVYLVYDKENIIDRYILYMLKELKTCSSYLMVVCNSRNINRTEEIACCADEVVYRDNIGYDAGGFKEALCSYIGWDKVIKYDELVLANDSFFGPFKPMKDIFYDMGNKLVDFWGLTKHGLRVGKDISSVPEHIQSYFLVIRSRMLHSTIFRDYWDNMPFYNKFWDVVIYHEERFTTYFKEKGFKYDVLADTEANDSKRNFANNYSQYAMISYELIRKRNFPFLKKQQIAYDTLMLQTQENLYQAICYIEKETNYDVNLIWDNIIRTLNMADIQKNLHLQYIISQKESQLSIKRKIAILIFVEYKEAIEYILEYLKKLNKNMECSILIISEDNTILEKYKENLSEKRGLYFGQKSIFENLFLYDYVCVLHDFDMSSDVVPSCTRKSYFYSVWENLFKNESHIIGIIKKFEEDKRLGFLASPQANFADYFGKLEYGWDGKYVEIKKIVDKLRLHCPLLYEKPPFRVTNNFWIRGKILKYLSDLDIGEYIYLPYLWSYFAQHMGYYSGIVESMDYASINEVNMQYYLKQIVTQCKHKYGDFSYFNELEEKIMLGALKIFCGNNSRVLLYGVGFYAQKYRDFITNIEACVVSDNQEKDDYFDGIPVKFLSEIENLNNYGIVLCLSEENQRQVIPLLKQRGVKNYFCII